MLAFSKVKMVRVKYGAIVHNSADIFYYLL